VQQIPRGSTLFSMQYQVLARKWRPQNFQEIVGQEHVSRTLLNALQSGRVAHAFLFSGPRGSGKTTTARILAKALNCHRDKPGEPCGACPSCTEIAAGNCIDVLEIDAASNTGVDNIRQLIEQSRYNPARDRNKIFIIDEVHMLSTAAFGALLKTLEEPPARVIFIMATTEYHKIPATILSRCQQYSFKLIRYPLILDRLRVICKSETIQISDAALEQVVFSSGGSMRDAMSALDQVVAFSGNQVHDEDVTTLLGLIEPRILSQTVRAIANNDLATLLNQVGELVEAGQDLNNFCRRLSGQFRNLMVLNAGITDPALLGIPESLLPDLRAQAELFSKEDLLRLFEALLKIEASLRYATQIRFQLEMGLIELAHITRLRSLETLVSEFASIAGEEGSVRIQGAPGHLHATAPALPAKGVDSPGLRTKQEPAVISESAAQPGPQQAEVSGFPSRESLETPAPAQSSRDLLIQIAAAVGREALESLLQTLDGARLQGDDIILEPGAANEFFRRQIKENLSVITQAAMKVVGRKVAVRIGEPAMPQPPISSNPGNAAENKPEPNLLEKAKQEPIVKSFLDVFPGQVKAEKIDT
jgi:DNA polymerase III subunit gamma/tau